MPDDSAHPAAAARPQALAAGRPAKPLSGRVAVPGDKSISHRALILGGLAVGRTEISGLLEGEDVLATAAALRAMGADIVRETDGRWIVHGVGLGDLAEPADVIDLGNSGTAARLLLGILATHPFTSVVTGDASSAAFPLVAALIVPGSDVTITGVGLNPPRAGLIASLKEMGADIALENQCIEGGEPVADLHVRAGMLKGADIPPERAPSMIDEYPVLAAAAAHASGRTIMRGLAELRVKESDRLTAIAAGLTACGVRVDVAGDDLIVQGTGKPPAGGARIATQLDHRIAMAFLVFGLGAKQPV